MRFAQDIWEYPRGNWPGRGVWNSHEAILEAYRDAWNALMAKSEHATSIATTDWAQIKT